MLLNSAGGETDSLPYTMEQGFSSMLILVHTGCSLPNFRELQVKLARTQLAV